MRIFVHYIRIFEFYKGMEEVRRILLQMRWLGSQACGLFGKYLQIEKQPVPLVQVVFLTGSYLSSQAASSQVLSTYKGLTTVFGMGTGGSP